MLMTLPSELRYSIFELLAGSLHFYFPHPDTRNTPNALGFLTTCRLFHTEASPLILPNATFHCRATEHVVDLLFSLSREQISSIRHLTFRGTPFPLYLHPGSYTTHGFDTALKLFPGLQLDTLVVRDPYHGPDVAEDGWGNIASYHDVEEMVSTGKGFKELRYIVANPAFLQWEPFEPWHNNRLPQPTTWDGLVRKRDGAESGACVEMYIAKSDAVGVQGATLSDITREPFDQEALLRERTGWSSITTLNATQIAPPPPGQGLLGTTHIIVYSSGEANIPEREVLVVVKRGKNCDYVECGSDLSPEVKNLFESKSWEQIKEEGLVLEAEEDPTAHL